MYILYTKYNFASRFVTSGFSGRLRVSDSAAIAFRHSACISFVHHSAYSPVLAPLQRSVELETVVSGTKQLAVTCGGQLPDNSLTSTCIFFEIAQRTVEQRFHSSYYGTIAVVSLQISGSTPPPRMKHTLTAVRNTDGSVSLVMFGGRLTLSLASLSCPCLLLSAGISGSTVYDDLWLGSFNTAATTITWQLKTPTARHAAMRPAGLYDHAATQTFNRVLIMGGRDTNSLHQKVRDHASLGMQLVMHVTTARCNA